MLNEGSHPEYFDELCALAAAGHISEAEFVELQDHMEQCTRCQTAYAEFVDLLHCKLPLMDPKITDRSMLLSFFSKHSSYRSRFLARARKQGLAISQAPRHGTVRSMLRISWLPAMGYVLAAGLILVVLGVLGYSLHQSNQRVRIMAAEMPAMSHRIGSESSPRPPVPESRPLPAVAAPVTPPVSPPTVAADAELARARKDQAAAEVRSRDLEAQLQAAASELESVRAQHKEASDSRNQLEKKLAHAEQTLNRAGSELQRIRQGRSEDAAMLAAQGIEIRALSAKLATQTEMLERERTLLAAGRDIHDLMGARNLHIVDVLDVDSKGKDRRAFGRVFYTEGKSLIFYAFDLADRSAAKRNASFQVWGARGTAQSAAQNLGVFFVDDQKQNRWVLKFEDPRILAEIDSVFVTVERPGGSPRPTGRKFLYAYLKANPNHP